MCTSCDWSFKAVRTDANYNVPLSAWKTSLIDESEPSPGEVAAAANEDLNIDNENRVVESHHIHSENSITQEVKCALNKLLTNEL